MTTAEYQAARDAILKQMAQPLTATGPVGSVTNRSIDDLRKALAALDAQFSQETSGSISTTLTQFSRE